MSNFFIGFVDSTRRAKQKSQRDHMPEINISKRNLRFVFLPEISKKSIFMKSENKSDAYKVLKIMF